MDIPALKKILYWFLNFEDEPLMSCRLCNFHLVKVKTQGDMYWSSLPNYLAVLLVSYWFIGKTLGFYKCIVPIFNISFQLGKSLQKNENNFCSVLDMFCLFTEIQYFRVKMRTFSKIIGECYAFISSKPPKRQKVLYYFSDMFSPGEWQM